MTVRSILNRLVAIGYIAFVFISSALFFLIALVIWVGSRFFDQRLRFLHKFTCLWASLYLWIFPPWSVTVSGKENIRTDETYVIVSNHQSLVDILVVFTLFRHFKWVSKAELFNIPLIGWNMYLNGYVRLERGRNYSVKKMYQACERHLQQGSSIYLFPEGTRSESGRLRDFKEGAFALAKRQQVPILPIVISGSRTALPKNSLNFHGEADIQVTVLPPIDPESFVGTPANELAMQVRLIIENKLNPDAT